MILSLIAASVTTHAVVVSSLRDGDTFNIQGELFGEDAVRIENIDTPEVRSAQCNREKLLGREAKGYARALLEGQTVTVTTTGRKSFDRVVGRVTLPDGRDFGRVMIEAGYAVRWTEDWADTPRDERWCTRRDLTMPDDGSPRPR
ncbi:MAG: thermonuclease family protein [Litorimonas sp.]